MKLTIVRETLASWAGLRVLVVGDVMLDRSIVGSSVRISPEAPVPVVSASAQTDGLGGAANVAAGVRALGAIPVLVGVTGSDEGRLRVVELLEASDIDPGWVESITGRPTTVKTRIVAGNQQIARVDQEDRSEASPESLIALVSTAFEGGIDAVVLSDYAKGVLSKAVISTVIVKARSQSIPVIVDPKHRDPIRYAGASVLTPNLDEFVSWSDDSIDVTNLEDLADAAGTLARRHDFGAVVVTMGGNGILVCPRHEPFVHIPGHDTEVFDVTGAGDSVVATMGVALAAGLALADAARLANLAGAIAVSRLGTAVVRRSDLDQALSSTTEHGAMERAELIARLVDWRRAGLSVVFTNGCFDVLHAGHLSLLRAAHAEGDILVVGLNSDASVRRLKGPGRPLTHESDRAAVLAELRSVDAVAIFGEDDPTSLIELIEPDVLVKGGDYRADEVIGGPSVRVRGGRVVIVPIVEGYSTTGFVAKASSD